MTVKFLGHGTVLAVAEPIRIANRRSAEMSDEFDDLVEWSPQQHGPRPAEVTGTPLRPPAPRLVARLYAGASRPLRAKLLDCLLTPLGTLGLAGVAAGAFAVFLHRSGADGARVVIEDAGRYSNEQILELARFVAQVSPEALQQFAGLIAENPVGMAAFSASAAMLLLRAVRPASPQMPRQAVPLAGQPSCPGHGGVRTGTGGL